MIWQKKVWQVWSVTYYWYKNLDNIILPNINPTKLLKGDCFSLVNLLTRLYSNCCCMVYPPHDIWHKFNARDLAGMDYCKQWSLVRLKFGKFYESMQTSFPKNFSYTNIDWLEKFAKLSFTKPTPLLIYPTKLCCLWHHFALKSCSRGDN